jgi:NADPH:quinone reductase-like Zn-dependent oxidoreductase
MSLYPSYRLALPLPNPEPSPSSANKVILVWGGSSSTGSAAIQLAAASGVTVVSTASSKNHAFVKSIGATAVLDYNDTNITEKLVEVIKATGKEFAGAVDSIAGPPTFKACVDVVKALGGGKVVTNWPAIPADWEVPEGIEASGGELDVWRSFY